MNKFLPLCLLVLLLSGCATSSDEKGEISDSDMEQNEIMQDNEKNSDGTFDPIEEPLAPEDTVVFEDSNEEIIPPNIDAFLLNDNETIVSHDIGIDSYTIKDYLNEFFSFLKDRTLAEIKDKASSLSLTYSDGVLSHIKDISEDTMTVSLPNLELYSDSGESVVYNIEVDVERVPEDTGMTLIVDTYNGTITISKFGLVTSCVLDIDTVSNNIADTLLDEDVEVPVFEDQDSNNEPIFEDTIDETLSQIVQELQQPDVNVEQFDSIPKQITDNNQNIENSDTSSWFFY